MRSMVEGPRRRRGLRLPIGSTPLFGGAPPPRPSGAVPLPQPSWGRIFMPGVLSADATRQKIPTRHKLPPVPLL
jgi:hypothetical protein